MFRKRTFWLVVSTFLIVAIAFSLTPVRAWASSVLSLFRVQRVTVIEFDPAAAESNREALAANQEQIEALMEDLRFTEGGEVSEVASVDEAAAAAGFTPRLPTAFNGAKLAVKPGSQGEFTIQRDQMQALFDALGVDINIPEEADGKTVTVDVPSAVMALEGCPTTDVEQAAKGSCTALVQMPSPTVDAPAGINPQQMGAAMLQFLGYSKDEAARLSERIDWASTLVLPIPQDEDIAYQDVSVDGVTGTYLEADSGSMLIWVKDGVIYGLRAPGGLEDMLSIVSTLQ